MNKHDVSIATITWARDEEEEKLLRQSLQQLAKLHMPVFITDGGSNAGFVNFLRSFSNFILLETEARGLWAQVKNSVSAAYQSGSLFIFYTEPDKHDFFVNGLPRMLDEVIVNEQSGIITASRTAAGFATFPVFQKMTETTINNCCTEIIGAPLDYTYGPFIMKRQIVPYLELMQEDIGWGWRPYTFAIANRLGYTIEAFEDDFSCPADQQKDNHAERIYRMRQLNQNIQGLVLAASVRLNDAAVIKK